VESQLEKRHLWSGKCTICVYWTMGAGSKTNGRPKRGRGHLTLHNQKQGQIK
jgi:hypothetical protein